MTETLVLADDVRRHLGAPRMDAAEVLGRLAAEHSLPPLNFTSDWAGRAVIGAAEAAELVRVVEQAQQAAARRQALAEHAQQAQAAMAQQRLERRSQQVYELVGMRTGDLAAATALAHTAGRGEVSDEQLARTLDGALGRWEQGFETFDPVLRPGHERLAGAADYDDLAAKQELQQPATRDALETGELSPRARRRFRELLRGTVE